MSGLHEQPYRGDSACSEESAFGDDSLSHDEFVQRRLEKMRTLMGAQDNIDELSSVSVSGGQSPGVPDWGSTPSSVHAGSYESATPSLGGLSDAHGGESASVRSNMTVYEKLQALALAENITLDDPPPSNSSPSSNWQRLETEHSSPAVMHGITATSPAVSAPLEATGEAEGDDEEEDEEETYEIGWDGGPLGLLFKASASGQAVIRRVNKKGAATGLQYARAGDVLVALNGESVSGKPFGEVIEQLKRPQFPIKLEFRPLKLSDLTATSSSMAAGGNGAAGWGMMPPSSGASNPSYTGSPVSSSTTVDMRNARSGGASEDGRTPAFIPPARETSDGDSAPGEVEYDVVWSEGPLGCELKQRNGLPAVKSVTGTGVTPSVAQIAAGDILVSINGLRTEEIGFKSTITLMMRATKPVYLRFHRGGARQPPSTGSSDRSLQQGGAWNVSGLPESSGSAAGQEATASLEPKQYTVLWRDGPLGIQIRTSSKGRVVVARLTGAGAPNVNDHVRPGDIFVRVAGVDVDSLGIAGAFELLKSVEKPVVLVFQRRNRSSRPRSRSSRRHHHHHHQYDLPSPGPIAAPTPSTSVPSFRQLREQEAAQAAAAAAAGRPPIARAHSVGYNAGGSPGRPAERKDRGHSLQNLAGGFSGPSLDGGYSLPENYSTSDDGTSQHSYDRHTDYSNLSPRSSVSQQQQTSLQDPPQPHGADGGSEKDVDAYAPLPASLPASDSPDAEVLAPADEQGYPEEDGSEPPADGDESLTLTGFPPPPSYLDVFTASGRAKDALIIPPRSAPSTDLHSISDSEPTPDAHRAQQWDELGGVPPMPPASPSRSASPPATADFLNDAGGAGVPPPPTHTSAEAAQPPVNHPSRLQELRQQYIESERRRNQMCSENGTVMSTYSAIDDSGLVIRHHRDPSNMDSPTPKPDQQLPLPELWVRWSEGPLGITFKRKHGQIVVSRLTGSGYSPGLTQLRAGDWLVSFNNQSTRDLRLGETMELLKRMPKPVDMCFVVQ